MLTETAQLDLTEINAMFANSSSQKIVDWTIEKWGDEAVMTSSFGAESALMIHLAIQRKPDIKIIMVDTGYLFPETWQHMERLRNRFNLNVWVYRTKSDPIAWLVEHGETDPAIRKDDKKCCAVNKEEPMTRAMLDLKPKAWLRGIRGDQADTRSATRFMAWDARYNLYAVSPIRDWSTKQIYQYMKQHDLPYHPLYEKGYPSIGCNPLSCTRAISAGEDPRAGRWSGKGKVECGIHLGSLDSSQL
jgi:phosphoadenosine phosphosulfate reductase